MGRITSNRKLAAALLKTLHGLEVDTSVDHQDPGFIRLKCNLLQRIMNLELDCAETQSSIHLVEPSESEAAEDSGAGSAVA